MKTTLLFTIMAVIMMAITSCVKHDSNSIFIIENDPDSITCDTINDVGIETDSVIALTN